MRLPYPEAGEVTYVPVTWSNPAHQSWVRRGALPEPSPGTLGESLGLCFSIYAAEMLFSWLFGVCL